MYKVSDRDGLYVAVLISGTISFRYDYRINGRRETLVIGQYGRDGITLAEARDELIAAKKLLNAGQSPAAAKRDGIKRIRGAETFTVHTDAYMKHVVLADSTRAMKQSVIDRDILPVLGNKMMSEITTPMVRDLCDRIVERGGRATAVQARESSAAFTGTPMTAGTGYSTRPQISNLRRSPCLNRVTVACSRKKSACCSGLSIPSALCQP